MLVFFLLVGYDFYYSGYFCKVFNNKLANYFVNNYRQKFCWLCRMGLSLPEHDKTERRIKLAQARYSENPIMYKYNRHVYTLHNNVIYSPKKIIRYFWWLSISPNKPIIWYKNNDKFINHRNFSLLFLSLKNIIKIFPTILSIINSIHHDVYLKELLLHDTQLFKYSPLY